MPGDEIGSVSDLNLSPRITIVFQNDISDDEELTKEIADMYITNRTYYYSGKTGTTPIQTVDQILSEKEDDPYVLYGNINFDILKNIAI